MKPDEDSKEAGLSEEEHLLIDRNHLRETQDSLLQDSQGLTTLSLEMENSVINHDQQEHRRELCLHIFHNVIHLFKWATAPVGLRGYKGN